MKGKRMKINHLGIRTSAVISSALLCATPAVLAGIIDYTYDGAGRLITASYGDAAQAALHYDPSGSLREISIRATRDADAAVSQTVFPGTPAAGAPFEIAATVSSLGALPTAGVRFTTVLPAGLAYISASSSLGSCSFAGGVVTCELDALPPGGAAGILILVRALAPGALTSTVSIASANDESAANNTSTLQIALAPPPALALRFPENPSGGALLLEWPALHPSFMVEETDDLSPPVIWSRAAAPSLFGGTAYLPIPTGEAHRFFRLRLP